MSAAEARGVPKRCSSLASTFSSTSESDDVFRWRRSSRISTSASFDRVGQVAVVREADAVRRIDVERLRLGGAVAAGRRVAHVADADVALELQHVPLLEHVAHQADVLAQEQLAFVLGHDARGVLAAVLQHGQRVVDLLVDGAEAHDSDDSAHGLAPSGARFGGVVDDAAARSRHSLAGSRPSPRRPESAWTLSTRLRRACAAASASITAKPTMTAPRTRPNTRAEHPVDAEREARALHQVTRAGCRSSHAAMTTASSTMMRATHTCSSVPASAPPRYGSSSGA